MSRVFAFAAFAFVTSACPPKRGSAVGVSQNCARTTLVTENGVGSLSLDSSIAALRAQCPQARDIRWLTLTSYDSAIVIRLPGATILAIQDSVLRPDRPADVWVITGDSVRLPENLFLTSSWATIARRYGRYVSDLDYDVTTSGVIFCKMQGMSFTVLTAALNDSATAAAEHPTDVSIARDNAAPDVAEECK